jgi:O-antigen/teichoic acid export membrane protein
LQAVIGYRLLAGNASSVLVGRLVSIGLGVVLATVLFKALGPQQYGAWSLLTLIAGYSTLIDFGLAAAIERRVATLVARDAEALIPATINTTFTALAAAVCVIEACVVVLLRLPLGLVTDPSLRRAIAALPVCAGITLASLALGAVLAGQQRMRILYLWRILGLAVGTIAVIVALGLAIRALDVLLIVYTTGSVVTMVLVWKTICVSLPGFRLGWGWNRESIRDLMWFGGVMQFATMVPPLAEYAFRLVVGARFGLEFSGVYDLGARAAVIPRSLAGALFAAMVPFAVQTERRHGAAGLEHLVRTTSRYVALFILSGTAILLAFATPIIGLWLGASPLAGDVRACFQIVLVAHALGALAVPAAMVGRALGRPAAEAITTAVAFALAVVVSNIVPSFTTAAALLWGLPAVGGFIAWAWLSRSLRFRFVNGRDSILALSVAVLAFIVARPLATGGDAAGVLVRLAGASCFAAVVAGLAELGSPGGRAAAKGLLRGSWRSATRSADVPHRDRFRSTMNAPD